MKTKELHALSMTDLRKQLKSSRQELFNLRFQMATGQLANHRQIRSVRRTLAQILTEMHEKEDLGVETPVAPAEPAVAEAPPAELPTVQAKPRRGKASAATAEKKAPSRRKRTAE
jgi:large subunit ribosomal protein L29